MQNGEGLTTEQIQEFLKGSEGVRFVGQDKGEAYAWIEGVLVAQEFTQQKKKRRGAIRAYVEKVTGLGSAQVTRLVRRFKETGRVEVTAYQRQGFARKYTDGDIARLAEVDRAHQRLNGAATRHIWSANMRASARPSMCAWRESRPATCTTCGPAAATASGWWGTSPHGRQR